MELHNVTWQGHAIDDAAMLRRLPETLRGLLIQINGFIQFGGGLHVRGACTAPDWHSLRFAWDGEDAFHRLYSSVMPSDVPFAEDAVGDQYLLREGIVFRLFAEFDQVESLETGLFTFLHRAQAEPMKLLSLEPLMQFSDEGGQMQPGELLSVMPPLVCRESLQDCNVRTVATTDRRRFLAGLARQIRDIPDGGSFTFDWSS